MYNMLERLGASLLARFVPQVEAHAGCNPNVIYCYSTCWQCGGRPCCATYYTDCAVKEILCD